MASPTPRGVNNLILTSSIERINPDILDRSDFSPVQRIDHFDTNRVPTNNLDTNRVLPTDNLDTNRVLPNFLLEVTLHGDTSSEDYQSESPKKKRRQ
jgi:hypothetical protein